MFEEDFTLPDYPIVYSYYTLVDLSGRAANIHSQESVFVDKSSMAVLREDYGDSPVVLSSSNAYSHDKTYSTLREYIDHFLPTNLTDSRDASSSLPANETFYLFGNNVDGVWKELSDHYRPPPCLGCAQASAVTLGLGGKHSGVSFHFHGNGFSEVIHGSKMWFLFPANLTNLITSHFDSNMTVHKWYEEVYPAIKSFPSHHNYSANTLPDYILEQLSPHLYECTIRPGELLYFPSFWMHATLNMDDYNFFVSDFLDYQLLQSARRR